MQTNKNPLRVFISYSHKDESLLKELLVQLNILKRAGIIETWHDRKIGAGSEWERQISEHLEKAEIILILVSADFLASDYCYDIEMSRALDKHQKGETRVVPIIIRACDWQSAPFSNLQALPKDAMPVSNWNNRDEAWNQITIGIKRISIEILDQKEKVISEVERKIDTGVYHSLLSVFKKSGVPTITFVEPDNFNYLKLVLAEPGRGVVIEGPSGIGKTTALKMAIAQNKLNGKNLDFKIFNAGSIEDLKSLESIEEWHDGSVAIDDFHRLDKKLKSTLANYLKYLADNEFSDKKLIIVGIPSTGQRLVDIAHDLSMRFDTFKLGKASDEIVLKMIEKGEKALNIIFDQKSDIVLTAGGSLNIAQILCRHLALLESIENTQPITKNVKSDLDQAILNVMMETSLKFEPFVRRFASFGNSNDLTCIRILKELARCEDGFLPLYQLIESNPELTEGVTNLLNDDQLKIFLEEPICTKFLFFDAITSTLIIDDPQLTFYLLRLLPSSIARMTGKREPSERTKVFISYSHSDSNWLERLLIHLKPLEREGVIDLWADTRIKAGERWREEIQKALSSTKVAILIISSEFLASDFIVDEELPPLLKAAEKNGTKIIPLIVSPSRFLRNKHLSGFQAINHPDNPLINLSKGKQEEILVNLANTIEDYYL